VVIVPVGDGNDIRRYAGNTPPFYVGIDQDFPKTIKKNAGMAKPGELHICRSGFYRMKFVIRECDKRKPPSAHHGSKRGGELK
jgi:hypothetical protein